MSLIKMNSTTYTVHFYDFYSFGKIGDIGRPGVGRPSGVFWLLSISNVIFCNGLPDCGTRRKRFQMWPIFQSLITMTKKKPERFQNFVLTFFLISNFSEEQI
jgi:hypothetical protein